MAQISKLTKGNALFSRFKGLISSQKFQHTFADSGRQPQVSADSGSVSIFEPGEIDLSKWRKLDSRNFGITRSKIPASAWTVLKILQSEDDTFVAYGFEAYLVGGCVRDLILNRIPKDFDIITNAGLKQIKKQFHRSEIVGLRFPICRVHVKGSILEVSSFDTVAKDTEKKVELIVPKMPKGCNQKDFNLWNNSMHRDFTVNSLFFDPFVNRIYDYTNAVLDLRSLKLRTLVPAHLSFGEDCARILRGLRLAARLKLSFTKEIENAMHELSSSLMKLSKSRIMMELNYMMSYGAAEPSLCLLQRYNILEILLPFHGAYLAQQASKQLGETSVLLMKLFSSLDQLVTCGQPSHASVWVALLAFHVALTTHPQNGCVILTFASLLYHANWRAAIKFVEKYSEAAAVYSPEVSGSQGSISDGELAERVAQLAVQVQKSINILTEGNSLQEAMSNFPGAPCSGVVFVSNKVGKAVELTLDILVTDVTSLKTRRKSLEIDYDSLRKGHMREIRFLLGKVILNTIAPGVTPDVNVITEEEHVLLDVDGQQKEDGSQENFHGNVELMKPEYVSEDDDEPNEDYELLINRIEKHEYVSEDAELDKEYELLKSRIEKHKSNQKRCSDLVEAVTKKEKNVAAEPSEEMTAEKQDLIDDTDFLGQVLDRGDSVTIKKTKGNHAQLPKDEIRMVLEEVKYQLHSRDVTGKEKKNDEKYQNTAVNHLIHLMKDLGTKDHKFTKKHDSLQEHSIEEVNEKLDCKNHISQGKKSTSGDEAKQRVNKQSLSALFR